MNCDQSDNTNNNNAEEARSSAPDEAEPLLIDDALAAAADDNETLSSAEAISDDKPGRTSTGEDWPLRRVVAVDDKGGLSATPSTGEYFLLSSSTAWVGSR